jgi:site-specific recombinase XerD
LGLYRRKRSPTWWMSFTVNGKQYQRSTGTENKKLAENILAKVKTQIVEGTWFDVDQAKQHTFDELMEKYLNEHSKVNKTLRSYMNDKIYVGHLKKVFTGLRLDRVTPQLISQYKSMRLSDGKSPQTVKHEMNCLSHAFNLAVREWNWIDYNPCLRVQKPKVNNQILRWLTDDEEKRLLNASNAYLNGQLPAIITLAIHTGMRQGEILSLKWENVDMFKRAITIMQSKTKEPKTIPLNDTGFNMLLNKGKVVSMSGYVFATQNGTQILNTNLQREFSKVVEKAKMTDFRFHDLRHTFATRLVQSGVDLYSVAKLLGHKDIKTTQRYAHHHIDSLRQSVRVLDSFFAKKDTKSVVKNS